MTYFNPLPRDKKQAAWHRRLVLAESVLSSTPLADFSLWSERLSKFTKLYHEAITECPALGNSVWNPAA